MARRFS